MALPGALPGESLSEMKPAQRKAEERGRSWGWRGRDQVLMGHRNLGQPSQSSLHSCPSITSISSVPVHVGGLLLSSSWKFWLFSGQNFGSSLVLHSDCSGHTLPSLAFHPGVPHCPEYSNSPNTQASLKTLAPWWHPLNLTCLFLARHSPTSTAPGAGLHTQLLKNKHELYYFQRMFPPY